ncbi:helix-turn-helix domain-containing protein [Mycolicibacterium sphagni]|uniref:helix-turn-helix domain-containing protein n=1 Tax=Mycolicibacterium sphagni TaxID=1786 RepID=UPI0021F39459|nr:helix-turn-helix transcriptional regulator [Mycolicibacterium sphagni]MCV7178168.1 helix-turn-helix domain-containing protein [Mycolicibacterium sphagni]
MAENREARAAIRDFLVTRRARITPDQAGLDTYGGNRRVKGLRREEVALLSGISAEYYIRLERGNAAGASPGVIDAIATALHLDADERAHLIRLIDAVGPGRRKRRPTRSHDTVRPGIQVLLDGLDHLPAFVFNRRLDIIATNELGRALYAPIFDDPVQPPNVARFMFLNEPRSREFWPNWEQMASNNVALLRTEAGRDPDDPALIELIGQLSTRSEQFRILWGAHDVKEHRSGIKTLRHPLLGEITLPFEDLHVDAAPDQLLMVYTPPPGSTEHDAIMLLASWNAEVAPSATEA